MSLSYSVRIEFDRESPAPERVFEAMALYVKGLNEIQAAFIEGFGSEVEFSSSLAATREGSCIADISHKIVDKIRKVSFKRIFDGIYLGIQSEISTDMHITNIEDVEDFSSKVMKHIVANEDIYSQFTSNPSVNLEKLVNGLNKIDRAKGCLSSKDYAEFGRDDEFTTINRHFSCPSSFDSLLLSEERIREFYSTEILIVRRPSYVDGLQWDCEKPNGQKVSAKLTHEEWFGKFIKREKVVWPGDALEAKVVRKRIERKKKKASIETSIYEVIRVIPEHEMKQLTMDLDNG
jgi:hypothetical protein